MVVPMAFKHQKQKNPTILWDAGLALSSDCLRATRSVSQGEAARGEAQEFRLQKIVAARAS